MPSMERMRNFWCARIVPADTGKLYPGQRMFVCSCGHKERLSKFQERRKKEGGGVSKRDVHAYMKKQQKEAKEPVNSAFADALKNIRLN